MTTFSIPEQNMGNLRKKLEKIQKRITKLGVGSLSFKEVGEKFWEQKEDKYDHRLSKPITRRLVIVEIEGEAPCIAGWVFVGTIQHLEDANILRTIPGYNGGTLPERFRTVNPTCEHCNLARKRNDTYLLQKDEEFKQVGRNCLADFLGGLSPEGAAEYCMFMCDVQSICEDESNFYGGGYNYRNIEEFLLRTLSVIHTFGWKSRGQVYSQGGVATVSLVLETFNIRLWSASDLETKLKTKEDDRETVEKALEWIRTLPDEEVKNNDYLWNLKTACNSDFVREKTEGIIASLFGAYDRDLVKRKEKEIQQKSLHYGTVGKREKMNLTLYSIREFESDYGVRTMHRFKDESGNIFVWFKSGESSLEPETTYQVTGTIKEHSEYNGIAQTMLTRCKATEV
jgi:hypothetical protein